MQLIKLNSESRELPFKVLLSLEALYEEVERYAGDASHPFHKSSQIILEKINQYPELRMGVEDFSNLDQYQDVFDLLFQPLFPKLLQDNEIKMVNLPFRYIGFYPTRRLSNILKNAGSDHAFEMKGFNVDQAYIYACSYILGMKYQQNIMTPNRPIYMDIPNQKTGKKHHYRVLLNGDFMQLERTDLAPAITPEDIDELLRNGNDIELWKQKFPPNSYVLRGFGIMNLFDTTQDTYISQTRSLFLRKDEGVFTDFQEKIKQIFGIDDLQVGMSVYDTCTKMTTGKFYNKESRSLLFENGERIDYSLVFCEGINACVVENSKVLAISDVEAYGNHEKNSVYRRMKKAGAQSLLLVPIKVKGDYLQILEIASPRKNELNILSGNRLDDIVPFLKIALERYFEENENTIESTIQENYTSIHPSVNWKFMEAAANYNTQKFQGVENPVLEDIEFKDVYPLYGQSDIVNSSNARNEAIQADLELQLLMVISTFQKVLKHQDFPVYEEMIYRIKTCLKEVRKGLKAGDEVAILNFLKEEIYPVFNHIEQISPEMKNAVEQYVSEIDPDLKVVYRRRKAYEDTVTLLNDKLASFLDRRQEEAQKMFPHYFERYKTDGVEYNIYIGDALVNNRPFNKVYLHNLRLWQLETMCEIEQVAYKLHDEMPYPLRVASLVLVHSSPLSIKFRMDEKRFDVDGAYNVRYEIVKKRIDKSYIKSRKERLTQPGKIAIVYSQDSDAEEYLNYLKYLQSKNKIGEIEFVELSDLQGVSGLRAIRAEVIYQQKPMESKKPPVKSRKALAEKRTENLTPVESKAV